MEIALKLDPDADDINAVREGLRAYNRKFAPQPPSRYQPFALHIHDPETGKPIGGVTGYAAFDWVFIELFHVPEQFRRQGLGRQLMARVEAFAREQGCIGVWLDTFSFQARPFYEKLGFTVFGTLEDHPVGGARHFMSKRF